MVPVQSPLTNTNPSSSSSSSSSASSSPSSAATSRTTTSPSATSSSSSCNTNPFTRPLVGVGVILCSTHHPNHILIGRRLTPHHGNNQYSLPGGHLEFGESFEQCAVREIKEECNIDVSNPEFVYLSNNIFPAIPHLNIPSKHYVTIFMRVWLNEEDDVSHYIINNEPHKCESWIWYDWYRLVKNGENERLPLFAPLQSLVDDLSFNPFSLNTRNQ